MKKTILFLLLILSSGAASVWAETVCRCGEYSSGIYSYYVSGDDCCLHTASNNGTLTTYQQQLNGVWVVDTATSVSGTTAQNACCKNN